MPDNFSTLRTMQLQRSLEPFVEARKVPRPKRGWIRSVRLALNVSAAELARTLKRSRHLPLQLEKAEESDAITLKSLRGVADALGCDLVYALVPKVGTMQDLARSRELSKAREHVTRVEHSMALEDQASGGVEEAVEMEVRRQAKAKRAR